MTETREKFMSVIRFASQRALSTAVLLATAPASISAQGDMLGGMQGEGIGGRPFKIVVDGGLTLANGELKSLHENGFYF